MEKGINLIVSPVHRAAIPLGFARSWGKAQAGGTGMGLEEPGKDGVLRRKEGD